MRAAERLFAVLLRAYPRAFRERFGAEMRETLRHALASRPGPASRAAYLLGALADALASGAAERLHEARDRAHAPTPSHTEAPMLETLRTDLRDAARALVRRPGFLVTVVATLALGIGANTAVFSLVDAVLLHPLPVERQEALVAVHHALNERTPHEAMTHQLFRTVQASARGVRGVAGFRPMTIGPRVEGRVEQVEAAVVSGNYFGVLGVRAARGRLIAPEDDRTIGAHPVAVLSHEAWQAWFGGEERAVGAVLHAGGVAYTVIGVAPRGFRGTRLTDAPRIWFPLAMATSLGEGSIFSGETARDVYDTDSFGWIYGIARLERPGAAAAVAQDLNRVVREHRAARGLDVAKRGDVREPITVMPLPQAAALRGREDVVRFVVILLGVVTATLLIACVNVANLMLVRAGERRKELAMRSALGASRGRLLRQLLLECLLLAAAGGAAAVLVGVATMRLLSRFTLPGEIAIRTMELGLDARVLAFTAAVALGSALAFGVVPAVRASRPGLGTVLRLHGGGGRAPAGVLLVAQVALSLVLLVGAGLFVRSLRAGLDTALGFDPRPLAAVSVDPTRHGYDRARAAGYYVAVEERARALPGVAGAAVAAHVPLADMVMLPASRIAGPDRDTRVPAGYNPVSPSYFDVVGLRLVAGRGFTAGDDSTARKVAILNESAARTLSPGADPLGRELRLLGGIRFTVVGVVRDTKYESVRDEGVPVVFVPIAQRAPVLGAHVVVRSAKPEAALAALRRGVASLDPEVPVREARLVADQIDAVLMPQRFGATLLGLFALVALAVTAVGMYGVAAYGVTQRVPEIGIRIALGAGNGDVVRTVLGRSAAAAGAGALLGLAGATAVTRSLERFLFGIVPLDPASFGAALAVTAAAVVAACWLPARRAVRVDPMVTIRSE